MQVQLLRQIHGPNVYSHRPVVIMKFDLGELTNKTVKEAGPLKNRLFEMMPHLKRHYCKPGKPGGFVEQLNEAMHINHVIEHVVIEMLALAGLADRKEKICTGDERDLSKSVIESTTVETTRYLMPVGVELVEAAAADRSYYFDEKVIEAKDIAAYSNIGPSTASIIEAAERRGIPWSRENEQNLIQLGYGKNLHLIQAALSDNTSCIGVEMVGDKDATKRLLGKFSIPAPRGEVVSSEAEALNAFKTLACPVVIKPLDGRQGKGVSLNLSTPEEVTEAFTVAKEYSPKVLVEEQFEGKNYRVLVVDGKMVAASERLPCYVTGDGVHSIGELITIENQNPMRGEGHEKPLTQIKINSILLAAMDKQGLSLEDIPPENQRIMLCSAMNISTGGTVRDVTDEVHPSVRLLCERASRIVNLDICGIDLVVEDISAPMPKKHGGVIEINAAPGLRMHTYPSEGKPRDVGGAIVEMLYPSGNSARIPIISVTGTNGKTTVTRMIGHVLANSKQIVGLTTTDGILINGQPIVEGDTTGPISAKTILGDRAIDVAVLETARGGLVRRGLGYDWSDISVLTNITEDHIGQDGIESVDDLINIKALVAERVREGGTLILNAEDENVLRVLAREKVAEVPKTIVFFSLDPKHPVIQDHLSKEGLAYFPVHGRIVEARGAERLPIIDAAAIPTTMNGMADFEIANSLAAIAACRAYGLSAREISSLQSFGGSAANPGRNNLYRVGEGYVLIDYGHNPAAFNAICRMASRWEGKHVTGVISVPGDRDDKLIEASARVAAAGFDRVIIKQDRDLRGRGSGEVAELLCRTATAESPGLPCEIVLDEMEAFSRALDRIKENDVIVFFYDKLAPVLEVLKSYNAVPVTDISGFVEASRMEEARV